MDSSRSRVLLMATLVSLSLVASACGSQKSQTETTKAAADISSTTTSLPASTSNPQSDTGSGSDAEIAKLNACELVPGSTVEKITSGKLQVDPSNSGPVCIYAIGAADDKIESYKVMYMPSAPNMEFLKALSPEEKGEKVAGPWKEAWLGEASFGGFRVLAIYNEAIAIEVSGERKDVLPDIAKVAAEGLKE